MTNNLKELLKEKNIKPSDFAKLVGVSRATLSLWITGKRNPNMKHRHEMCKVLNVDYSKIFEYHYSEIFGYQTVESLYGYSIEELVLVVKLLEENHITPDVLKERLETFKEGYQLAIKDYERTVDGWLTNAKKGVL